jgi:antibiotic biosynthesis monooxygenase (ABM) superfamily enzyme
MPQGPTCILFVELTLKPGQEEAFNSWYEKEYIPTFVRDVPGITLARRFVSLSADEKGSHRYLTVYEFADEAALQRGMEVMKSREAWRKAWKEWEGRSVASISDGLYRARLSISGPAKP